MEKAFKQYSSWCQAPLPEKLCQEAQEIKDNKDEIYDRFCKDMTFGTSGLRGKMGLGSNRINEIVIRRATMGVADYLLAKHSKPKVIIGYDTRINSKKYAERTAADLAVRGVDSYIFGEPTPVPVVSFAIRYLKADGGVMITASHNPKEYNGYKVYDHAGNQIDDKKARMLEGYIEKRAYFEEAETAAEAGRVFICGEEVKEAYLAAVHDRILNWTEDREELKAALSDINIVYTPLNGAGRDYALRVFDDLGIKKLSVVKEQLEHNGHFPTCPSPNPENERAFDVACKNADDLTDIIIATDPDSDRMGVMAKKDGRFQRLTGDQVGILMLDYVCHCHSKGIMGKNLKGRKTVYKSFVSSPFAEDIADYYGVEIKDVPTGFKNIAAEMEKLKDEGREEDFLFGFEESLGYLYGNYTRDKDGILALQMVCLMAACLKAHGKTLYDKLTELYQKHGYVESKAISIEFKTEKDREKIEQIMEDVFEGELKTLLGESITIDRANRQINMFRATLPQGHQVIIRPSGTEIKVKIYAFARGKSQKDAVKNLDNMIEELEKFARKYH